MLKKYLITALVINFLAVGLVFAQTNTSASSEVAASETITAADLGVESPGLLPTNPFYFLKEWGRGIRLFFTFNPVSKAGFELQVANQKSAELQRVEETLPDDSRSIEIALQNYQESQQRLKARLESLRETSQDSNMDRLLERLADRAVKHEKVINGIIKKFGDRGVIKTLAEKTREEIEKTVAEASKKDDPEKFVSKIEKALGEAKEEGELLDRLEKKLPEAVKERFQEKFKNNLEEFEDRVKNQIESAEKLIKILEAKKSDQEDIKNLLEQAKDHLVKAKQAASADKYGEAFGLARSAAMLAKNGLQMLEAKPRLKAAPEAAPVRQEKESEKEKPAACIEVYDPVCGSDGKTYSNSCFAEVAGVVVKYQGECRAVKKEMPAAESAAKEFKIEADDRGFYSSAILAVPKGIKVKIIFLVRTENVYFGGLDFRSPKFNTVSAKPGGSATVEFLADESFDFSSYWPATGVLKATGKVIVQ